MTTPAGLMLPNVKSYEVGSGNPRDSAMMSQKNMSESQNNLNNSVGGKRRKHKITKFYSKGGADDTFPVPQFQMLYTPQGGPGTNPNNQIADISTTSTQASSWKANDNAASKMGGSKKRRKGYNRAKKSRRQQLKGRKNKTKKRFKHL
jgi:hypothetical protein